MRRQNEALQEIRDRGGVACTSEQVLALQKEHAWCMVQIDRVNTQLRNALWSVALEAQNGAAHGDVPAQMGNGSSAAAGNEGARGVAQTQREAEASAKRPPDIGTVSRQCDEVAAVLLQAVVSRGVDEDDMFAGTEAVHPLVASSLSLLMLLRIYEEQALLVSSTSNGATGSLASAHSGGRDWDEAFESIFQSLRSTSSSDPAREAVCDEIVRSVQALRRSIESS